MGNQLGNQLGNQPYFNIYRKTEKASAKKSIFNHLNRFSNSVGRSP